METPEVIVWLVVFLALYFVPSGMAVLRDHHNISAIFVLNLFLGWLIIGWIVALVWAFTNPRNPPNQ